MLVYGCRYDVGTARGAVAQEDDGKARFQKTFAADADKDTIEKETLADDRCAKYTDGKKIVKVIVVPKRIINIVVK